jgi:hypothetical protein
MKPIKILIPVKASEELPPISPDYKKQQISDDYIVSTIKGLENFSYYDHKVGKWATWNDWIEYWYKPVSKAEYDKQVLAEKIDEIDKAVSEVEDMHPYKQAGNRDSYSEYNEGWSDACDILGETIKKTKLK